MQGVGPNGFARFREVDRKGWLVVERAPCTHGQRIPSFPAIGWGIAEALPPATVSSGITQSHLAGWALTHLTTPTSLTLRVSVRPRIVRANAGQASGRSGRLRCRRSRPAWGAAFGRETVAGKWGKSSARQDFGLGRNVANKRDIENDGSYVPPDGLRVLKGLLEENSCPIVKIAYFAGRGGIGRVGATELGIGIANHAMASNNLHYSAPTRETCLCAFPMESSARATVLYAPTNRVGRHSRP